MPSMNSFGPPKIVVKPPGPKARALIKRSNKAISRTAYKYVPLVAEAAKGSTIKDVDGNVYIDFTAGIGLANVGYSQPSVLKAINSQAQKLIHIQQHGGYYEPLIELGEKLKPLLPGSLKKGTFFFLNSGSEANEAAIKIARSVTKKQYIISFFGNFHGRSFGAVSLCGVAKIKKDLSPLVPGVILAPYPYCYRCYFDKFYPDCDLFCAEASIHGIFDHVAPADEIAMVMLEPIQAMGGGVVVPPPGYISRLKQICDQNGILLAADEVYTGFGRTGKLFAVEHENITPDLMIMAKSIAAGLPLSAVVGKKEIMDAWPIGAHGSTFGGCPVSCAAAIEVLKIFEKEKLVEKSAETGAFLLKSLKDLQKEIPLIGDIRGKGMLIGIELVKPSRHKIPAVDETKKVLMNAFRQGLLLASCGLNGNAIRVSPPLGLTTEEARKGIDIIKGSLRRYNP
jgi:4-aminobutyrate aminotransferase